MLCAADYRMQARKALAGRWNTCALIYLIYSLIVGALSALARYYIGAIGLLLVSGPFALGIAMIALNVVRGEKVRIETLFDGFKDFGRSFTQYLLNGVLVLLWTLLFVVPGIVASYSYSMSFYILRDNPDMSANDARKQSIEMMRGNKWRLFCLHLTFLGWLLLSVLTFGVLLFWVQPYMEAANAAFYLSLLPAEQSPPEAVEVSTEQENPFAGDSSL